MLAPKPGPHMLLSIPVNYSFTTFELRFVLSIHFNANLMEDGLSLQAYKDLKFIDGYLCKSSSAEW